MKLSIVIPTLNEASVLRHTILHIFDMCSAPELIEVLIIDNGSNDQTLESISDLEVRIFRQPSLKGRKYAVLNFGASQANGDVLMFLDADTLLPPSFDQHIQQCMTSPQVVGGAFDFQFIEKRWFLSALTTINRIRIRLDHNFLGDQAVFCSRFVFEAIGGYPPKMIMESSFLCQLLKQRGKLQIAPARIRTSARRFLENGFLKVFWFDFQVWFRYLIGKDVDRFGASYWQHNDTPKDLSYRN